MAGGRVTFMFWHRDARGSRNTIPVGHGIDGIPAYNAYYHQLNRRPRWPVSSVSLTEATVPIARLRRTEDFNDYTRKYGLDCGLGLWLAENERETAQITCLRPLRAAPHGRKDVQFVRPLLPHLQRALPVRIRLGDLRLEREVDAGAFDRLACAVFVLSPQGRALLVNASAERLVAFREGCRYHPMDFGRRILLKTRPFARSSQRLGEAPLESRRTCVCHGCGFVRR
jgi:PAS domain-containing protein